MTVEIMRALVMLADLCLEQNNCKDCPLRDVCGKMPCEW